MPLVIFVVIIGLLFLFPRIRERLVEEIKALSDVLVVGFLRSTSRFGDELTEEGKSEQHRWRGQRLRNLRGLALRSKEAAGTRSSEKKQNS
jgi:hypothetical protein